MLKKLLRAQSPKSASKPAKRTRDDASDEDDAEIKRLEAKLGLKGSSKKRNSKLARDLARVGLPSGLDSLFADIDEMERRIDSGAPTPEAVKRAATAESSDEDEAPELVSTARPDASSGADDSGNDDESGISSDGEQNDTEDELDERESAARLETDGAASLPVPSATAWVPASRRGLLKGKLPTTTPLDASREAEPVAVKKKQVLYGQDAPSVPAVLRESMRMLTDSHPDYVAVKRQVQVCQLV